MIPKLINIEGYTKDDLLSSPIVSDELIYKYYNDETLIDNKLYFYNSFKVDTENSKNIFNFAINRNHDTMICGVPHFYTSNLRHPDIMGRVEIFKYISTYVQKKATIKFDDGIKQHFGYDVDINDAGNLCVFSDIA